MTMITIIPVSTFIVWVLYLLAMSLYKARARGSLTGWKLRAAQAFIAVCYLIDVVYNATIASLIFWEPPRWQEWTLTRRCNRHLDEGIGWRYTLAAFLCRRLLDPFAPNGTHCKSGKS